MKKAAFVIFILCFAFRAFAQEGKMVAVTAEKEVAIQNDDIAAARTAALLLAARDAVEKAYGTYINVQELPDARRIVAAAAAGVKYSILAEQQKKNRYWVKIQAQVLVPSEYLKEEGETREELGTDMGNFVQKYPQGEINWGDGFILAYGKGEITSKSPNAEELAGRAAEVDAKAHLLEIVNDIPVDDRMKAGQDQRLSFAIEGFVQGTEVVTRSKLGTTVQVTVKAPIRGVKGLSMTVFGYYTPEPPPPPPPAEVPKPKPPEPQTKPQPPPETKAKLPDARTYTGVVIDARNVSANAALFPKIQNTEKQEVYGSTTVNKEDLQKRGMASYAVVSRDVTIARLFPKALVLQASYAPDSGTSAKPKRQGNKPVSIKAVDAGGSLRTSLILSDEDAGKLMELDQSSGALKECRVVIVISGENNPL